MQSIRKFVRRCKLIGNLFSSLVTVVVRRVLFGPLKPSWGIFFETIMHFMQRGRNVEVPVEKARHMMEGFAKSYPGEFQFEEVILDSPHPLRVEWASPNGVPSIRACNQHHVILYLHGGAYSLGSIRTHRRLAGFFAVSNGARLLLVDYRLAPEYPYPAALEDARRAMFYLTDECAIPPQNIIVAGDSAGGGLSLALMISLVDDFLRTGVKKLPGGSILLSPWVNLDMDAEMGDVEDSLEICQSAREATIVKHLREYSTFMSNAPYDYLPTEAARFKQYALFYGQEPGKLHNPLVSPVFASDEQLSYLPPTLMILGGSEQLAGQCKLFTHRAQAVNSDFELANYSHMVHVFQFMGGAAEETKQATHRAHDFVKKVYGPFLGSFPDSARSFLESSL